MLKHFKLSVQGVIYFGHNPNAVKSAQSLGIVSYLYDPEKKDMDSLKDFLDKNATK